MSGLAKSFLAFAAKHYQNAVAKRIAPYGENFNYKLAFQSLIVLFQA